MVDLLLQLGEVLLEFLFLVGQLLILFFLQRSATVRARSGTLGGVLISLMVLAFVQKEQDTWLPVLQKISQK